MDTSLLLFWQQQLLVVESTMKSEKIMYDSDYNKAHLLLKMTRSFE